MRPWCAIGAAALILALPVRAEVLLIHSSFDEMISKLSETQRGLSLLKAAARQLKLESPQAVSKILRWGATSRTDAVLERHFNPETGLEVRERKVLIYLRKDQEFSAQILDLAHELVHAANEPEWDPYDPDLSPAQYVLASLEGSGGEVKALKAECEVALEGERIRPGEFDIGRCARYVRKGKWISEKKIREDFYRVGDWYAYLNEQLGPEKRYFPHLSEERPELYSSTGKAPYPVALLSEYQMITRVACQNSKKRVSQAKAGAGSAARSPASIPVNAPPAERPPLYLTHRCTIDAK